MEHRVQPGKVGGPIKLGYRLCWEAWCSVSAETAWKPAVRGSREDWEKTRKWEKRRLRPNEGLLRKRGLALANMKKTNLR